MLIPAPVAECTLPYTSDCAIISLSNLAQLMRLPPTKGAFMRKRALLLLILCMVLLLTACVKEDTPPVPEPTIFDIGEVAFTNTSTVFSEAPHSSFGAFGLNKNLDLAQYKGTTYAFDPAISQEDRAACIETTQTILNRIGTNIPLQVQVYTTDTYSDTFIENGVVYTHLQDWTAPEYVCTLLQGLFGEYCSYGAALGYANYLRRELYSEEISLLSADWSLNADPDLLDLNILCFRATFFDGKDIKTAKKVANTFVSEYIAAHGEKEFQTLLAQSGATGGIAEFNGALSDFYASRNIDYTPSQILYRQGGCTYDYIVKTEFATMYIQKDWVDMNMDLCPYTYEGFLHENYPDTKEYFTRNTQDMARYQQLFGLAPYNNDLAICFSNSAARDSNYSPTAHAICLQNTGSLMSTYFRALTWGYNISETWAYTGGAYYFSCYYDYYGNAMLSADYNSSSRNCFLELRENLGRDIDMATDFPEVCHVFAWACSFDDPNDGSGYVAGASFIGYLISRFGEEQVIEILFQSHDFGEFTYEELVADWQTFLKDNYSGYTKIK